MARAREASGLRFAYAPTMTVDEIRKHLENADSRLAEVLAAGVEQAGVLAPAVLEVIAKASNGVYLIPKQENLLFFGLHALAAARDTSAYLPFLGLLRRPEHALEHLLGEGFVETSTQLLLGLFDGNADPLYAALEDQAMDGALKWSVF